MPRRRVRTLSPALVFLAGSLLASPGLHPQDLPTVKREPPPAAAMLARVPERFPLRGRILDLEGRPAAGVTVESAAQAANRSVTDTAGRFALPEEVRRGDTVGLSGEGYVPRRLDAAGLWTGAEGVAGETRLVVARLTTVFEVGPEGGTFGGEVTFEVPPGAVAEPTVLRAAVLPPSMVWAARQGIHPEPLASVHLEPAGLTFAEPVRVRLPLPPGAQVPAETTFELYDPESQTYRPAAGAAAAGEAGELVLTLSHFSRYVIGDPSRGVERRLVDRTPDVNGDGRITPEDADLVVVLQDGTHEATWSVATTLASTVFTSTGTTSETTEEETTSLSAGVSFGGVGASVERTVSRETAQEVLEQLGFSSTTERSVTLSSDPIEAPEYERRCLFLLRIYNFWDVSLWEKLHFSEATADRFEAPPESGEWTYYSYEGDSIMSSERTVPEGRYAARWREGRREFYRQTDRFVVREPDGSTTNRACSTELPADPRDLWRGGDELGEARFFASGGGFVSVEYGGWGVLPTTLPRDHGPIECRRPGIHLEEVVHTGVEVADERQLSESVREREAVSASATFEVPLPGGLGVSGGASREQAAGRARGFSSSYGTTMVRQEETAVTYGILNAHDLHFSDHRVYKLHLLHTTRVWEPLESSEVPPRLRRIPTTGWRWFGDRAFARMADGYVMRMPGRWFASGPPVTTTKEVGVYVVRVAERPCRAEGDRTVPAPGETPSGGETETPGEQGALPPPPGSRAVLTGTVTAGEPATLTAVGPAGARLTGVVVEIEGEPHTTDEEGRVTYTPSGGAGSVTVTFTDAAGIPVTASSTVVPRPVDLDFSRPPVLDEVPPFPTPGVEITVSGGPFDGGGGTTATLDGKDTPVLAASPTEVVVATDPATPVGEHELVVTTPAGDSPPATLTFLRLQLEATATQLVRGQRSTARLRVEGTQEKLCIRVTNETPQVISLEDGESVEVMTGGGTPNQAELRFTGVGPGDFSIQAEVLGEGRKACKKH